jgi:hypothetical protein
MGDPEIDAMSAVATALEDLKEEQRDRILRWAAERYGVTLGNTGGRRRPAGSGGAADHAGEGDVSEDEITAEAPVYEHFAELFAAAQPKTNEDKALVAAYWLQAINGQDKWQASSLQTVLKNMGHAIPNVTNALSSNIGKKPQRIIQLQKSGNTRQARKTYKVTHEGLVYVQGLLGQGG